jgi:thymidylate synthase ThyX
MDAKIFIIDDQNPEDVAMMQALYSRSSASVLEHLEKVKKTGSGKFMESFYVGYGHASIGDCGSTTIFIENVSILAAKAIQDWSLYSGQETSTRYIDMSKQQCSDPIANAESQQILENWRKFYLDAQAPLIEHLKTKYPKKPEESGINYNKAIKARAFDILRAWLPAGVHTQLAWHTNLRQAAQKLALLNHHPDPLIRELGQKILEGLKEKYPHSFTHKLYETTEQYRKFASSEYTYHANAHKCLTTPNDIVCYTSIVPEDLSIYDELINSRPAKTELPAFLMDLGLVTFGFLLDYGSFRDLQRHRNGVCRMPLLTTEYGFHPWYLEQLPSDLRLQAEKLIKTQVEKINALTSDIVGVTGDKMILQDVIKQYYIPLGFMVACRVTYGLPALVYTIELRSGSTVHPTLRQVAIAMGDKLQSCLPNLTLHMDREQDEWNIRRGNQDIVPINNMN